MNKRITDYQSSSLEDLINDESFMLWISQPTEELNGKWNSIQQLYPDLNSIIQEGREIIMSLHFETDVLNVEEQQELWNTIAAKTTLRVKPGKIRIWTRYAAAAVLVGVLFAAGLLYSAFQQVTVQTPYGKIQTVTLPDGSKVTLNANSNLKYDKTWDDDKIREVWIEGEAFLQVNHLHKNGVVKDHQRFIVHSGKLNVEVLGTSFNVNDRRGRTEVALLEGKIRLAVTTEKERSLILAPGDIVEYTDGSLKKKPVNVEEYASWKDGKLYFKDAPVSRIFNYFEDVYGYKARVSDPKILTRKLSGTISSTNEKVFLETVAKTLNISITKDDGSRELIIKAN